MPIDPCNTSVPVSSAQLPRMNRLQQRASETCGAIPYFAEKGTARTYGIMSAFHAALVGHFYGPTLRRCFLPVDSGGSLQVFKIKGFARSLYGGTASNLVAHVLQSICELASGIAKSSNPLIRGKSFGRYNSLRCFSFFRLKYFAVF